MISIPQMYEATDENGQVIGATFSVNIGNVDHDGLDGKPFIAHFFDGSRHSCGMLGRV